MTAKPAPLEGSALGTQTYRYDAADRHMGIDAGAETMSYTRDPLDRLVGRQGATTQRYRYANMGDSPDFSVDVSGAVTERYLSLAGGVNVTTRGPTQIWSYPNLHGDVIARADAQGAKLGGTRWFSPWGEASANVLDNLEGDADLGYLGRHAKLTEHGTGFEPLINMGARPYHIGLGRFLTTDPVEGGCANDYVYVFGDPVNQSDLSGRASRTCSSGNEGWQTIGDSGWGNWSKTKRDMATGISMCAGLCWEHRGYQERLRHLLVRRDDQYASVLMTQRRSSYTTGVGISLGPVGLQPYESGEHHDTLGISYTDMSGNRDFGPCQFLV